MKIGDIISSNGEDYEVVGNDNPLVQSCILCDAYAICNITFQCRTHCFDKGVYLRRVEDEE